MVNDLASSSLSPGAIAHLIGIVDPKEVAFGRALLEVLEESAPHLVPRLLPHRLGEPRAQGVAQQEALMERLAWAGPEEERTAILRALIEAIPGEPASPDLMAFLEDALEEARSPAEASLAARALATAGSEPFLEHQRRLLGSKRPSELQVAVRLLGYGRYEPAVPMLLDVLRPHNAMVAAAIVWALGEIGSQAAVAKLHTILGQLGMTDVVIEALGKIGSRVSVGRLVPFLLEGDTGQRERAAEALARIARKNDGSLGDPALDGSVRATLGKVFEVDESRVVRFFALVALSLLGEHLEPARILAALRPRAPAPRSRSGSA